MNFEMCPKKKKSENHEAEEAEEEKKKQDGAGGKRTRVVSGGKVKGGRVTSRFLTSLKYKKIHSTNVMNSSMAAPHVHQ